MEQKKLNLHWKCSSPCQNRLRNLNEFSLEWFMYTKPTNSKIQKSPEVIKSFSDFCRSFRLKDSQLTQLQPRRISQLKSSTSSDAQQKEVSFSDFIIYFHRLSHENTNVSEVTFTTKKRSLVQHICSNLHYHLLKEVCRSNLKATNTLSYIDANGYNVMC